MRVEPCDCERDYEAFDRFDRLRPVTRLVKDGEAKEFGE